MGGGGRGWTVLSYICYDTQVPEGCLKKLGHRDAKASWEQAESVFMYALMVVSNP